MVQSLVRKSQWQPEGIHSLRHMMMIIMIIMIIINILYHHFHVGYLKLYTWNKPCFQGIQCWYHFCFYIVIIIIVNINNKIANNINAIPQLGFCSLGYSEVTYYQGFESWVGNLFAGKFVFHGCKLHKHGEFLCIFSSEFYPINAWIWYLLELCLCFL